MNKLFNWLRRRSRVSLAPRRPRPPRFRPALERLEAREVLSVTYHGGAVLPHVKAETVFFGTQWNSDPGLRAQGQRLDAFLTDLTGGSYLDMLTRAGYGVGRGQWLDARDDNRALSASLSDDQIRTDLQLGIANGGLQSPDGDSLYVVFVQPGVVVSSGLGASSAAREPKGFLGYHSSFVGTDRSGNAAPVRYAVIPYPGGVNTSIPFAAGDDALTLTASHEVAEAVTDPDPNSFPGAIPAWYDNRLGEIGDIVSLQYVRWRGYMVQKEAGKEDQPLAPADTVGLGRVGEQSTPGVFDPATATWYLNAPGVLGIPQVVTFRYGAPGWVGVVGDWDGDGVATVGVFDPATATWYLKNSNSAGAPDLVFRYGAPGWVPIAGDWTGTGKAGLGVFDPGTATFYLRAEAGPGAPDAGQFRYGAPGWVPVVGDWDGNGTTTVGVVDPTTETWYLKNSNSAGAPDLGPFRYGAAGWLPVVGDWDEDGRTSIGVVDPATETWYLRNTAGAGAPDLAPFAYGAAGWAAVAGDWVDEATTDWALAHG